MPGFKISGIGGNNGGISPEQRYYTSYSWEIPSLFSGPQDSVGQGSNLFSINAKHSLILKTAQLPSMTFKQETARGTSFVYKYAGEVEFPDIKISWYDSIGMSDQIKRWKGMVRDEEFGLKAASEYKRQTKIRKFLSDRPGDIVNNSTDISMFGGGKEPGDIDYILFGSWPTSLVESSLTYAESNIKSVEITISYDRYEIRDA